MKDFEWTDVAGQHVILTAGLVDTRAGQVFGMFATEADVTADDPDALAVGTVGRGSLSPAQIAMAERNSERLAD